MVKMRTRGGRKQKKGIEFVDAENVAPVTSNRGKTFKQRTDSSGCGHTTRSSIFTRLIDPGKVWQTVNDYEGEMSYGEIKKDFKKMIYMEAYKWVGGKKIFDYMYIEELLQCLFEGHVADPSDASNNSRTLQHFDLFPLDTYKLSSFVGISYLTHKAFRNDILNDDRLRCIANLKSFAATSVGHNFPNSCAFLMSTPALDYSGKGPFCKIVATCQVPMCKLSICVVFADVPSESDESYKIALFPLRDRRLAFGSRSFHYETTSNTFASQPVNGKCVHCIYSVAVGRTEGSDEFWRGRAMCWYRRATNPEHIRSYLLAGSLCNADIYEQVVFLHKTKQKDKISGRSAKKEMPKEKQIAITLLDFSEFAFGEFDAVYRAFVESGNRGAGSLSHGNIAIFDIRGQFENFNDYFSLIEVLEILPSLENQIKFINSVANVRCARPKIGTTGNENEVDLAAGGKDKELSEPSSTGRKRVATKIRPYLKAAMEKRKGKGQEAREAGGGAKGVLSVTVAGGGRRNVRNENGLKSLKRQVSGVNEMQTPKSNGTVRVGGSIGERVSKRRRIVEAEEQNSEEHEEDGGNIEEIESEDQVDGEEESILLNNVTNAAEEATGRNGEDSVLGAAEQRGSLCVGGEEGDRLVISSLAQCFFGFPLFGKEQHDIPGCCCAWLLRIGGVNREELWMPAEVFTRFVAKEFMETVTIHSIRIGSLKVTEGRRSMCLQSSESSNPGGCCALNLRSFFGAEVEELENMVASDHDSICVNGLEYYSLEAISKYMSTGGRGI